MSLGLVAYDDSEDESESESDSGDNGQQNKNTLQNNVVFPPSKVIKQSADEQTAVGSGHISDDEVDYSSTSKNGSVDNSKQEDKKESPDQSVNPLHLPESKLSLINTDIDIKCLTSATNKNGPVKITIPSLNEVIDESEPPSKKKLKPSQKGSGLFALLPSPKSSLVPQSVANRKPMTPAPRKPSPASSIKKTTQTKQTANKTKSLISYDDSGDEEESSGTVDFFSLESKDKEVSSAPAVDIDIPEISSISSSIQNEVVDVSSTSNDTSNSNWNSTAHATSWVNDGVGQQSSSSYSAAQTADAQPNFGYSTSEFMSVSNNDLELDQQAMLQLCGRRDRLKMQDVSLIDVSGDAIMPDSREWLTKQLTEEVVHRPSHKRRDGPTSQQKRKHQITYLAYQAKENELELKNQWANNRMSRKQTQAKYGF